MGGRSNGECTMLTMVNKSITRVSCISNMGGKEEKTNMLKREVIGTELIILESAAE